MSRNHRDLGSHLRPPSDLNPATDPVLDFPDREFGDLTEADYRELGFMGGLEVHQQLGTATKLFCRCPSGVYVHRYDAEVLRHMRPTLSELGEYDGTALMEFKTRKEIVYQLDRRNVCTYEIDDTPPFEISEEAIKIALEVCELFDLDLVNELHVMRKQYLDGSIPTGFQRTAMVGIGGKIPFVASELGVDRELSIRQLSLEEDSCREISDIGHRITFRTDRLGMPLTEVVTEPELLSPLELQAGARLVAQTTRASQRVLRGRGAARQDVNVSVAGGRRTEIKGVCHHRGLPRLVHNEAFRQLNLLRIRAELHRRGVTAEMLTIPLKGKAWDVSDLVIDAGSILGQSDFAPIRDVTDAGGTVAAIRLPGFGGLLTHRTQPGVTFAAEISDRVRVIACLVGRPFMVHSDLVGFGLHSGEWLQLHKSLQTESGDTVVVVWGATGDADTAAREVLLRAIDALAGVPSETRQAFKDGTNGFERILPGADRMYPDTDTPPLPIPDAWVQEIRANKIVRPFDRESNYRSFGFGVARAHRLSLSPWADHFDALDVRDLDAALRIEQAMQQVLTKSVRKHGTSVIPSVDRLQVWAKAIADGSLPHEADRRTLRHLCDNPAMQASEVVSEFARSEEPDALLTEQITTLRASISALRSVDRASGLRWAMGQVMPNVLGRVEVDRVQEAVRRVINEHVEAKR